MSNFQCLGVKQAKSTSVCCGIPLVLLQERREGGGHKASVILCCLLFSSGAHLRVLLLVTFS